MPCNFGFLGKCYSSHSRSREVYQIWHFYDNNTINSVSFAHSDVLNNFDWIEHDYKLRQQNFVALIFFSNFLDYISGKWKIQPLTKINLSKGRKHRYFFTSLQKLKTSPPITFSEVAKVLDLYRVGGRNDRKGGLLLIGAKNIWKMYLYFLTFLGKIWTLNLQL